jgi:hypothetical protein
MPKTTWLQKYIKFKNSKLHGTGYYVCVTSMLRDMSASEATYLLKCQKKCYNKKSKINTKLPSIRFHDNFFSGPKVVTCGGTILAFSQPSTGNATRSKGLIHSDSDMVSVSKLVTLPVCKCMLPSSINVAVFQTRQHFMEQVPHRKDLF